MKQLIITLLLALSLSAQEGFSPKLSFGIQGGLDHINSSYTKGTVRILSEWQPTLLYSLAVAVEANNYFSAQLRSNWQWISWFGGEANYHLREFGQYETFEHNLSLVTNFNYKVRPVGIAGKLGWNFRFVDFGDESPYNTSFPTWKIALVTTPVHFLQLDLTLGNYHNDAPISFGDFEINLNSLWRISDFLSISFDTGIGFSGTFSVAGFADRFFFQTGVTYDVPNL